LADTTAEFGALQSHLIADDPKKGRIIRTGDADLAAVDLECRHARSPGLPDPSGRLRRLDGNAYFGDAYVASTIAVELVSF
jgi:hypothetical protein